MDLNRESQSSRKLRNDYGQPKGKDFGVSPEQEVIRAEDSLEYNELPENEKKHALFTDGSCQTVEKHWSGRLLYVLRNELQKLLKEKVNRVNLQK